MRPEGPLQSLDSGICRTPSARPTALPAEAGGPTGALLEADEGPVWWRGSRRRTVAPAGSGARRTSAPTRCLVVCLVVWPPPALLRSDASGPDPVRLAGRPRTGSWWVAPGFSRGKAVPPMFRAPRRGVGKTIRGRRHPPTRATVGAPGMEAAPAPRAEARGYQPWPLRGPWRRTEPRSACEFHTSNRRFHRRSPAVAEVRSAKSEFRPL